MVLQIFQVFGHFTISIFLICMLCKHVMVTHDCNDIYFYMENFQLCPKYCTECSLQNSCILCTTNETGSFCRSKCRIGCIVVFIPNGTILRGCYMKQDGNTCCMSCHPYTYCSNCLQLYGPCLRCASDSYGGLTYCDKKCGNCHPDKDGEVKCDINTGSCLGDCVDGFYGLRCDKNCSRNCHDSVTKTRKCDKYSGQCVFGCIEGRFNDTCESMCSNTCLNTSCDRQTGSCNFGCLPGWYGDMCEKKCSETCVGSTCDLKTGYCTNGCVPGRYGNTCEHICSNTCRYNICNQRSGQCESGCLNGWYGATCDISCSKFCFNATCNQTSEFCANGCVLGRYSRMCEETCSSACNQLTCNQLTGNCSFDCATGWFGDRCDKQCSEICFNKTCEQISGQCEVGCVSGYYGDICAKNCSDDLGLINCNKTTTQDPGHQSGFVEVIRNQSYADSTYEQTSTNTLIAFCVVGVVFTIAFLLTFFVFRRTVTSRKGNQGNDMELPTIRTLEPIYDEIENISGNTASKEIFIKSKNSFTNLLSTSSISEHNRDDDILAQSMAQITRNPAGNSCSYRASYESPVTIANLVHGSTEATEAFAIKSSKHDILDFSYNSECKSESSLTQENNSRKICGSNEINTDIENKYFDNNTMENQNNKYPVDIHAKNRDSVFYLHPVK